MDVGTMDWRSRALCAQTDPEVFFPFPGEAPHAALAICAQCEVRATCLDWALTHNEMHGVWGGMTEQERLRLRQKQALGLETAATSAEAVTADQNSAASPGSTSGKKAGTRTAEVAA